MAKSYINEPLSISVKDKSFPWDEEYDVVVIGFGGSGTAAAIEAADSGADVLAIDRYTGGGATRMSGGVMYVGGGTALQKEAGFNDNPQEMYKYLKCETGDAVTDEELMSYCEKSLSNFKWVESHGVPYPPGFESVKTSYPGDDMTLYFSGNEILPPYCDMAQPAPRGHRALGKGMTGKILYDPLKKAAVSKGIKISYRTKPERLIIDEKGSVIGVEINRLSSNILIRGLHEIFFLQGSFLGCMNVPVLKISRSIINAIEKLFGKISRIRARGGVIISTGGFIYNPEMKESLLADYTKTMPLGTIGDDGSGIRLGQTAGASLRKMERGTTWLFINPPLALTKGIILDRKGERICNEEMYGATISEKMMEFHDKKAILLIDRNIWKEALSQLIKARKLNFQTFTGLLNLYYNRRKSKSISKLAAKCGIHAGTLRKTLKNYNKAAAQGTDSEGKSPKALQAIIKPPYYAVDCDIDNQKFITPSISLGGLSVNAITAKVLREDGSVIKGLYAAGRSAVGMCSHSYVSGLSVGDAIYSGRNAGKSAAVAVKGAKK